MLARIQQALVFALIAIALVWASFFLVRGRPVWAMAAAALILFGYALFLGLEFLALSVMHTSGAAAPPASARQLLRAWWGEVMTAPRVFFWRQPFRSRAEPDHLPYQSIVPRGVVLVHGFVCNRGLWNPWLRELRERAVPHVAVNLEPVFGSIDAYPGIIDAAVARIEAVTGGAVVLVGHSMGGLAIRAWLREYNADARVHRVVTIGCPHQGTWLARFGHTVNGRQMRQRSPWLTRLASDEPASRASRFTCFYGHCDNIVFPADVGMLPHASNVHLPGVAHVHMAFQPAVFDEVWRWLNAPSPGN